MTNEKMTYCDALDNVLAMEGIDAEVAETLKKLKASISKRNASRSKKSDEKANAILEGILNVLKGQEKGLTISEMTKVEGVLFGLSTQKVSPYANRLVANGKVDKFTDKKATYFKLVESVDEDTTLDE